MRLFARDIKGNIREWNINPLSDTEAIIRTGLLNGNLVETIIEHPTINKEIASRIAKKRKEGYVSLKDLGWSSTGIPLTEQNGNSIHYLHEHLPKCNTDDNNNLKPMKCQKFKEGIVKYPVLAQPKLNGLRCVLRFETWQEGEGLFKQECYGAKLRSKEGLEYYMPHITNYLTKDMFQSEIGELVFDGELYCHNMPLNLIKASCPSYNSRGTLSNPSGDPSKISFYTFDLAIPDIPQITRLHLLQNCKISDELSIKKIDYAVLNSDSEVLIFRDNCIKLGYEGCVIRDPSEEYAFGFRPSFIRKCKTHMDSEFLIVSLIPKPSDESLPLFILKNDINDEIFECNPSGSWEYQRHMLANEADYVGKYATVRYRERSGVKKVPFHANVIDIRNTK